MILRVMSEEESILNELGNEEKYMNYFSYEKSLIAII